MIRRSLLLQLLRYQYGHFCSKQSPVVALAVSNDPNSRVNGTIRFTDSMGDPGQEFWHVYGSGVLQFEVEVLNLCSKTIQQEIHESPVAASLMLYALGAVKTSRPFDRQVGLQMVQKSLTLSEAEILEHWIPSVQYINDKTGLTFQWWSELEKELTGEDKVNILGMTNDEINRENARREGFREGFPEGKQEGKQEVAIAMLQDGIEKDIIKKYFDFSDDEIEKLQNGSANGA